MQGNELEVKDAQRSPELKHLVPSIFCFATYEEGSTKYYAEQAVTKIIESVEPDQDPTEENLKTLVVFKQLVPSSLHPKLEIILSRAKADAPKKLVAKAAAKNTASRKRKSNTGMQAAVDLFSRMSDD